MEDNIDRLYQLLPAVYRLRDAEQGYPLKAFLRIINEQVDIVQNDIAQLYENWFIETAQDWVVPYIGDLIGYQLVHQAGQPGDPGDAEGAARNRILIPRREVANTIRNRRRKGTLLLLQQLANDVAGWPARAVEFYRLLGWTQNINHLHLDRARTIDLRKGDLLNTIDGPFEREAHTVDMRRINSSQSPGRYNIPSVGLFVWRLQSFPVTRTPAYCVEEEGPQCYTFSVLGQDTPLFIEHSPGQEPTRIAQELDVPAAIHRYEFERRTGDYYGENKSLVIYADWAGHNVHDPVPVSAIQAADLTDWQYEPPRDFIAVDPERGRMVFPPSQLPKKVRVSYHYAMSTAIGGGEYNRPIRQPSRSMLYRVGENQAFTRIKDALDQWQKDQDNARTPEDKQRAANAVVELTDSNVFVEPLVITLETGQSLQIRAASKRRPIIRLLDWQTDYPDSLSVSMSPGCRLVLDGLLVGGRSVQIRSREMETDQTRREEICASQVIIRHCTLVPGWSIDNDCEPRRPLEPSLELYNVRARVSIEHSILGPIDVNEEETREAPIPISISDSVVDSNSPKKEAIGGPGRDTAYAILDIRRSTVFGIVNVEEIELAENSIFYDCLNVHRRQTGCMRFCYVSPECRTPRRFHCQPDLAEHNAESEMSAIDRKDPNKIKQAHENVDQRVRPQFVSSQYGTPAYCQLAETCAPEITRGADDESEMGVFHDLFQPQRIANLTARLAEFVPAGMQAGIILVD